MSILDMEPYNEMPESEAVMKDKMRAYYGGKYRAPQKRDCRHTYRVNIHIKTDSELMTVVKTMKGFSKVQVGEEVRRTYPQYTRNEISWTITKVK